MSLGAAGFILALLCIIVYFAYTPFRSYVNGIWSDAKEIKDANEAEQKVLDEKQKAQMQKLREKEEKLEDLKREQEEKIKEQRALVEYERIQKEIAQAKAKVELKEIEEIEDLLYTIEADIVQLELSLKRKEEIKTKCVSHDNEYTKSLSLSSSGTCLSSCKDFDPKTLQQVESKDGICKVGNTCYYEHHKWSDLHQACIQDYKLHVKTNRGECKLLIDDVSYHISTTTVQIPLTIHRGGKYNQDQSKWGFYYTIEPITTSAINNELCLQKNGGTIRKKEQNILNGIIMLSNNDWYRSTHIEWNILHSG